MVPEGEDRAARYDEILVRVNVQNVDEMGMVSINWRLPQVGVDVTAMASDPDDQAPNTGTGVIEDFAITYEYSFWIPRLSRPVLDEDRHWTLVSGTAVAATYSPQATDEDSVLRVQVKYTDGTGKQRTVNALSEFAVRAAPTGTNDTPVFSGTAGFGTRQVDEDAAKGTLVGTPIFATDANDGDVLTYTLGGPDAASFLD